MMLATASPWLPSIGGFTWLLPISASNVNGFNHRTSFAVSSNWSGFYCQRQFWASAPNPHGVDLIWPWKYIFIQSISGSFCWRVSFCSFYTALGTLLGTLVVTFQQCNLPNLASWHVIWQFYCWNGTCDVDKTWLWILLWNCTFDRSTQNRHNSEEKVFFKRADFPKHSKIAGQHLSTLGHHKSVMSGRVKWSSDRA